MSFLSQTKLPVKHFKSTDANAPVLSGLEVKGEVKTLLKACLGTTGYGAKTGMGWTIRDETDFGATFVSNHPLSTANLTIDNSADDACFDFSIESKNNNSNICSDEISFLYYADVVIAKPQKWHLVASELSFVLFVECYLLNNTTSYFVPFFFGDCATASSTTDVVIYTPPSTHPRKLVFTPSPISSIGEVRAKKTINGDVAVHINTAASQLYNFATSIAHPVYYLTSNNAVLLPFYAQASKENQDGLVTAVNMDGRNMLNIKTGWDGSGQTGTEVIVVPLDFWSI